MIWKVRAYLRVSTTHQDVDMQRGAIQRYCIEKKIQVDHWYEDTVSGEIPFADRKKGQQMMEDAERGKFQELLLYDVDRLGRDKYGAIAVGAVLSLEAAGIKVTDIRQPIEDTPTGALIFVIRTAMSGWDKTKTVTKFRDGRLRAVEKKLDDRWLGGPSPYGYTTELRQIPGRERAVAFLIRFTAPISGHAELSEVKVVALMYRLAAQGKSCRAIADYLNDRAIPPCYRGPADKVRGKRKETAKAPLATRWTPGRVRNIIINPVYKGVFSFNKRRVLKGKGGKKHLYETNPPEQVSTWKCPAIVDENLWQRANDRLHETHRLLMAHATQHDYLLSGLVICGLCHRAFIGTTVGRGDGVRESYYRCGGRHAAYNANGLRCAAPHVNAAALEAHVWGNIEGMIRQPGRVIRQLERQLGSKDDQKKEIQADVRGLELELARLDEQHARNYTHYNTDKDATREDYLREEQRIAKARGNLNAELAAARKNAANLEANTRHLAGTRDRLKSLEPKLDGNPSFAVHRELVMALVKQIVVDDKKITVKYLPRDPYARFMDPTDDDGRYLEGQAMPKAVLPMLMRSCRPPEW
jgi:site-specific DNA recombinase